MRDTDRLQQCVDYLYAWHEAIMADSTLQSQYLQELDDIIASFDAKGTQNFRPFRIHRVVQTVKYNSLTGRLDRGKEYVMHFEFQSQSGSATNGMTTGA